MQHRMQRQQQLQHPSKYNCDHRKGHANFRSLQRTLSMRTASEATSDRVITALMIAAARTGSGRWLLQNNRYLPTVGLERTLQNPAGKP